ncbi:aspartyl protease family protein [Telmatospirillum siberiense]|uniref:aspartyl protease family protein n=1 Tax=Telmatospirillum siberiense TaxID=382514 RepID=UPI001F53C2CC|nr:aspartyl protease family protein [Telmatospirillum siberiense]
MTGRRLGLCALCFGLAVHPGSAARGECRIERQAVLPVTFNGFMPTVAASINGHRVAIGIDTGAQGTVITPETVEYLRLPRDPGRFTTSSGVSGRTWVSNAVLDELEFGGIAYRRKSVAVIALGQPTAAAGQFPANVTMAGLIGADLLSAYDVDFDVPARTITLYRVNGCTTLSPPWDGGYVTVPVWLTRSRRLAMPVEVNGNIFSAIFDTGASGIMLARSSGERIGMVAGMPDAGAKGTVRVAGETIHGLGVGIMDFPATEADMLIGEDYMRAHRFWLSYATRTLFIQADGRIASPDGSR